MQDFYLYNGEVHITFDPGKHRYTVTDGQVTFKCPSVTTYLKSVDKSGPLTQWAANCAVAYVRERLLDGTSFTEDEVAEILDDARKNWRTVKKTAADIGTDSHNWIENHIQGTGSPLEEIVDPFVARSCKAAVDWMASHRFQRVEIERPIYSRMYRYVGRLDKFCLLDGKKSIVDWKTSKGIYPEYVFQLAAYAEALFEETGERIEQAWIVRLGKDDGAFEAQCFTQDDMKEAFEGFLAARDLSVHMKERKKRPMKISIAGLPKENVLAALYNVARPQGLGFLHYNPDPMGLEEAKDLLSYNTYFDYLKGRVMKVNLKEESFDPFLYDRDNGEGCAAEVIRLLRDDPSNINGLRAQHNLNTAIAAEEAELAMNQPEQPSFVDGGCEVIPLGLSSMREHLSPALDRLKEAA